MSDAVNHQPQYIDSRGVVFNYDVMNDAKCMHLHIEQINWVNGYNPLTTLLGENPRMELTFQVLHRGDNRDRDFSVYLLPVLRIASKFPQGERDLCLFTSQCFMLSQYVRAQFSAKEVFKAILSKGEHTQRVNRGDLMHELEVAYINQAVDFLEEWKPSFDVYGFQNSYLNFGLTRQQTSFLATFFMEQEWIKEQEQALLAWKKEQALEPAL